MRRHRMSKKHSKKIFSKKAKPHPRNAPRGVSRGGIRF